MYCDYIYGTDKVSFYCFLIEETYLYIPSFSHSLFLNYFIKFQGYRYQQARLHKVLQLYFSYDEIINLAKEY